MTTAYLGSAQLADLCDWRSPNRETGPGIQPEDRYLDAIAGYRPTEANSCALHTIASQG